MCAGKYPAVLIAFAMLAVTEIFYKVHLKVTLVQKSPEMWTVTYGQINVSLHIGIKLVACM